MKQITKDELVALVASTKGATFIGLDYTAPVKLKKTGNPYADSLVTKSTSVSGMINSNYEDDQNRLLEKAGKPADFVAGERAWGDHVTPSMIVHGDDYSIQLRLLNPAVDTIYRVNGEVVEKSVLEPFMPTRKEETGVVVRAYKVDRIKAVRMGGEEYLMI